jgi:uncharacterized Zn finger protein (UPF0148 family)
MEIPDFMRDKLTDQTCPAHGHRLFKIDGKLMCQECQLIRAIKQSEEIRNERIDPERLTRYREEKKGGKSETERFAEEAFKSRPYKED